MIDIQKILIVDDEENIRNLLQKVLSKAGYRVYLAEDGEAALRIIMNRSIDIVITDIKMPKMNGIELMEKARQIDPEVEFIIMTAFATLDTAITALKMGARDYITKPFDIEEIIASLKRVSQTHSVEGETDYIEVSAEDAFTRTASPKMKMVLENIRKVADSHATAAIYGETGTGKELAAKTIHRLSERSKGPFIKVNCGAIPEQLIESELFGYEKGAFTGAMSQKPGRFELADGGTIFLDEIGELIPAMQVKLLRVIQEKEIQRLGGISEIKVDVRIISATNKRLEVLVKEGKLREDLYYRLNVVPVNLPPLRERKEDIEGLVEHFLKKSAGISGKKNKEVSLEVFEVLKKYNWPGNIRELENVIERGIVLTQGDQIGIDVLPDNIRKSVDNSEIIDSAGNIEGIVKSVELGKLSDAVDSKEKEILINALRECGGNRTKTSERIGISRRSLHRKLLKYEIED